MARTNTNTGGGGGGTVTGSGALPRFAIWDAASNLTSYANATYDVANDRFTLASGTNTDHGIFYNGTGAPNPLGAHAGIGFDFEGGSALYTFGASGVGNGTLLTIDDTLAGQSITLAAKNQISLLVNGADANYIITDSGAKHLIRGAHLQFNDGTADRWFQVKVSGGHKVQYGDYTNDFNKTSTVLDDVAKTITNTLDGSYGVYSSTPEAIFLVDTVNLALVGGDIALTHNGFRFLVADTLQVMDFAAPAGQARFGDIDNNGNGTRFIVDDQNERILMQWAGQNYFVLDPSAGYTYIGDIDAALNSTRFIVDDNNKTFWFGHGLSSNSPDYATIKATDSTLIADNPGSSLMFQTGASTGNAASPNMLFQITLPGVSGSTLNTYSTAMEISGMTGFVGFSYGLHGPLTEYANNAAALVGGLSVGDFYQTTVGGDAFVKRVI